MGTNHGPVRSNRPHRHRRTGEQASSGRGQAIAEFALVLPVMLLMLAGIIDFGFAMYTRITVINAAGDGARAASLQKSHDQIASAATRAVSNAISGAGLSGGSTTVKCIDAVSGAAVSGGCKNATASSSAVVVSVSYAYHSIFASFFGTTIPLGSTVQMVVQQ